jgi:hypothetical protein
MIISHSPDNNVVLSSIDRTDEFKIKNSSKAFSILSSGLYANKIKAIIRELSCNAYDSHVAAGKKDIPFDVHLPNRIEPWFSIRDYGTGLDDTQVKSIYTTYFESTKTHSNEFVGALGLGSKSPFSYTENFSITTIKNGKCWIFSAFVNEHGIPSIASMGVSDTTEPNGVEIKFSVDNQDDIVKFVTEAPNVFIWFETQPNISGNREYTLSFDYVVKREKNYEEQNIIPGIHVLSTRGYGTSKALMGNICYPIDVPNAKTNLTDKLHSLLSNNLVMEFNIGELDFQASREGLAYTPLTISSIKNKLQKLSDSLYCILDEQAKQHNHNSWFLADFLVNKNSLPIWKMTVTEYVNNNNLNVVAINKYNNLHEIYYNVISISREKCSEFNISINSFEKDSYSGRTRRYDLNNSGIDMYQTCSKYKFIINDTTIGAGERCKRYIDNLETGHKIKKFILLQKIDKDKDMNLEEFFKSISNPPDDIIINVSTLPELEKKKRTKDVTVVKIQEDNRKYYNPNYTWKECGKLQDLNNMTNTMYYIPLSGYNVISNYTTDFKGVYKLLKESGFFGPIGSRMTIYGIRKGDIESLSNYPNWINIERVIIDKLQSEKESIKNRIYADLNIDYINKFKYNKNILDKLNDNSPFKKVVQEFNITNNSKNNKPGLINSYMMLANIYSNDNIYKELKEFQLAAETKVQTILNRYPLLRYMVDIDSYLFETDKNRYDVFAGYINLIDDQKKELTCSLT